MSHPQETRKGSSENQDADENFFQKIVERMRMDIKLKAAYYGHGYSTMTRGTAWAADGSLQCSSSAGKYNRRNSDKQCYPNLSGHVSRKLTINWKHRTPFVFTIPSSIQRGFIKEDVLEIIQHGRQEEEGEEGNLLPFLASD